MTLMNCEYQCSNLFCSKKNQLILFDNKHLIYVSLIDRKNSFQAIQLWLFSTTANRLFQASASAHRDIRHWKYGCTICKSSSVFRFYRQTLHGGWSSWRRGGLWSLMTRPPSTQRLQSLRSDFNLFIIIYIISFAEQYKKKIVFMALIHRYNYRH